MSDVGTARLFENDRVIVWEMLLEPGESAGPHRHYTRCGAERRSGASELRLVVPD